MSTTTTTNRIVTSCKDCAFALYEKNTQAGCAFDLLDKYRSANINVMDAYDEEKEFNVIDRICIYSRHKSSKATLEQVLEQTNVKYQIMVILDDNKEGFLETLNSITQQTIKPKHIAAIKPGNLEIKPFWHTKVLKACGIAWRYQDCQDPDFPVHDLIDICIDIVKHPFYIVIPSGYTLPSEFSYELNDLVNSKFTMFSYAYNKDVTLIPTIYHVQLGGNAFTPLIDKIYGDDKLKDKVRQIGELIPCMSK